MFVSDSRARRGKDRASAGLRPRSPSALRGARLSAPGHGEGCFPRSKPLGDGGWLAPQPVLAGGARAGPAARLPGAVAAAPHRAAGTGREQLAIDEVQSGRRMPLWPRSSMPGIFNLNISPLSISAPVGDGAEINRSAGRSPGTGSGRRQLMRQIPPRCLMFQGYDRTVYKTSSVIYTVIISRGALNFRFTCSFNTVPRFRLIPGYCLAESRREAAGAAGPPRGRGGIAAAPRPSPPSQPGCGGGRGSVTDSVGATDPPGSCIPPRATPRAGAEPPRAAVQAGLCFFSYPPFPPR